MKLFETFDKPRLQKISHPLFIENKIEVLLLRLDKIHPTVNGNKWFKLKYNLQYAIENNYEGIATFGGQYSNHIYSTAAAANLLKIKSVGIIAGANPKQLSHTLLFAQQNNMQLHFVSRENYRKKAETEQLSEWKNLFPNFYFVPEGGSNNLAVKGVGEVLNFIDFDFDYIVTACGTGGTLAGLANYLKPSQKAIGISVLKGDDKLTTSIQNLIGGNRNFEVITGYHFGGYAKTNDELRKFIQTLYTQNGILLEQVYTAKMMLAVIDLANKKYFKENSSVVLLHTGGLQGLDNSIVNFKK